MDASVYWTGSLARIKRAAGARATHAARLPISDRHTHSVSGVYFPGVVSPRTERSSMDYETEDMLVRVTDHVTIVRLKLLTVTNTNDIARLSAALNTMIDEGSRRLVVDFKHVEHVGSATLGLMISLQKKMKAAGGRLVISHPEQIGELLRVSNTAQLFELAPDSKAAYKLLKPS